MPLIILYSHNTIFLTKSSNYRKRPVTENFHNNNTNSILFTLNVFTIKIKVIT